MIVELTSSSVGDGGGATIPATTNLIKGDGAGNGADSGVDPSLVVQGDVGALVGAVLISTGASNVATANTGTGVYKFTSTGASGVANFMATSNAGFSTFNFYDDAAALTGTIGTSNSGAGFLASSMWLGTRTATPLNFIVNTAVVGKFGADGVFYGLKSGIFQVSDATTTTVVTALTTAHATSNAQYAGAFGVKQSFKLTDAFGTIEAGGITALIDNPNHGAEDTRLDFTVLSGGLINTPFKVLPNGIIAGDIACDSINCGANIFAAAFSGDGSALINLPIQIPFDTGWVDNADHGDKTDVIATNASVSTQMTNLVAAIDPTGTIGAAAIFAYWSNSAEKTKALQFASFSKLLANA